MKYLAPSHVAIALLIQVAMFPIFGLWAGAVAASCVFVAREVTQAEYRWIDAFGAGLRANMPWYAALQLRAWNLKGFTDFLVPAAVVFAVAGASVFFNH